MKAITMQEWDEAGSFTQAVKARKGQSSPYLIEEDIYWHFLESVPPVEQGKTRAAFINITLPVQEYFLAGEPYTHVRGRAVYLTFCKALDKFYYLGLMFAQDMPEYGKQYALTGATGEKCIANGNSWKDSEVKS